MSRLLTSPGEHGREGSTDWSSTRRRLSAVGGLRTAVLALGLVGLAYVAARRLRSSGASPIAHRRDETVRDAGPGDVRPGEGRRSFSDESGGPGEGGRRETAQGEGTQERNQGAIESDGDSLPGPDLTSEKLEERAKTDANEEPAEPGEMTVDEDIVEDISDEERT